MRDFLARLLGKGSVTVDNVVYTGKKVVIENGNVFVDDVRQSQTLGRTVSVRVEGAVEELQTVSGDVHVNGPVNQVETTSGDVKCAIVHGNVQTVSGDVETGHVAGNVRTVTGRVGR